MIRAFEGRGEAVLRSAACVALSAACAACGLLPGWQKAPPEPVVATPVVKKSLQVSAAPAFRLIVRSPNGGVVSRLFVVNALVKNVDDVPLEFRPETARLLLPDGSDGTIFDQPRARELLRRTILASLGSPLEDTVGDLSDPVRSRLTMDVLAALLAGAWLTPGQEAHGYLVADTRTPVTTLEGVVLEVSATRTSDQSITRASYEFATRSVATDDGGN